jgi:charged multivesicular body protein 7
VRRLTTNSRGRLASLYADFSSQLNTNPEGYQANLAVWRTALTNAARAGVVPAPGSTHNLLTISSNNDLARALQHTEHGTPTCLPAVLQDAIRRKDFVPVKDWQNSQESIYNKRWVPTLREVIQWGANMVLGSGTPNTLPMGTFVVVKNVEDAAKEVLNESRQLLYTSTADRILSRTAFLKRFSHVLDETKPLTLDDLNLLLKHLARDRNVLAFDGDTIKFKAEAETAPVPITPEDKTLASLRDSGDRVHAQLPLLQLKIESCQAAAREAVEAKQMIRAKTALRSKKLAESALTHQSSIALQLEEAYIKLQEAADQVEIVDAMKAGAEAMKALHEKVGGTEGVQKVMDDVHEQVTTVDEITNLINDSATPVDEGEIDDEFEALKAAEREKEEQEEAAKTAARLAELAEVEKAQKEKEAEREKERQANSEVEKSVQDTSASFSQLSVVDDQEDVEMEEEKEEERIPIAA